MPSPIKLSHPASRGFWEIPVLHEDPLLLALDKPAHLPLPPTPGDPTKPSLVQLLHEAIKRGAPWARERQLSYLANAHRLDADTSGLLLLACTRETLIQLANQLGAHQPTRTCLAFATGSPDTDTFEIDAPLAPHPARPEVAHVDFRTGKKSITRFEVRERFRGFTLLACHLLTDRHHQLRAHLRHIGLPVAGDADYGGSPILLSQLKPKYRLKPGTLERALISRVALHSDSLNLLHPATGLPLALSAPLPKDFQVALKYLRRYGTP